MKQWRIKTKRDWVIAAGFVFLLSYLIASRYKYRLNDWLMNFSPEKMSKFNQPENHGMYLLAIFLAAVLGTALWFWQRYMEQKRVGKEIALVWAGVVLLLVGVWFSYQAECRQIVNTPATGLTPKVRITDMTREPHESVELTKENAEQIVKLCLEMKSLAREEQERLKSLVDGTGEIYITITYPKYKNHSYNLWFSLKEDMLYLNRGNSTNEAIFYDGTEIRNLLGTF